MSAPTTRRPRPQPAVPVAANVPSNLTHEELRIVALYRATHARSRAMFFGMAQDYARIYPCNARPVLHLVRGGAA